jgi:hypothetical protein
VRTEDALRAAGLRYVGALRLAPGRYTVKALARVDESGRIGLGTTSVEVPVFGASTVLPPMSVQEMGKWVTVVSPARGGDATDVLTLGNRPFIPMARAELGDAAAHEVALMLVGVETENLAVTPRLVAADGTTQAIPLQLAGRSEPDDHGLVKLLFRLESAGLAPGTYEIHFDVVPSGQEKTTVSLPIIVR